MGILTHELAKLVKQIARREWEAAQQPAWRYANKGVRDPHERLRQHVSDLRQLASPVAGKLELVGARLASARTLAAKSIDDHPAEWTTAITSIADEQQCPLYKGLQIKPQVGLVPLGRNSAGLWEFWHMLSGARPEPAQAGGYAMSVETGIVLILVPGGTYPIGAQDTDENKPNYSAPPPLDKKGNLPWKLRRDEQPVLEMELAPFLLSKYELSQSQWRRLAGANPSRYYSGVPLYDSGMISPVHALENVTWSECDEQLRRWSLETPTEAQWETAARAGSPDYFWWGSTWPPPEGSANADDAALYRSQRQAIPESMQDDGFAVHAPIGEFLANPWGFHSILGNVNEWCRDWYTGKRSEATIAAGSGELYRPLTRHKVYRGGSYAAEARDLHSSRRSTAAPDQRLDDVGVRPMRALD